MTAYIPGTGGTLPSDANTVERAATWVYCRAAILQPTATYTPIAGGAARKVIETVIKTLPDNTARFVGAALIPMSPTSDFDTGRLWEKVTTGKFITEASPSGATDAFVPGTSGTAFSTVTTIQKAIIYLSLLLKQTCGYKSSVEDPYDPNTGNGGDLLSWAMVEPLSTENHGLLYYCRISLPIDPNYHWMTTETYKKMLEASQTAIADANKAI